MCKFTISSQAKKIICNTFAVTEDQIKDAAVLKAGMTNRSFSFVVKGRKYIMRIPGEGTEKLINRRQEAEVYSVLDGRQICDQVNYINPETGYKISEFFESSRVCNPLDQKDLERSMEKLRQFHGLGLKVNHEFDVFKMIDFYEQLWNGMPSCYPDYETTKKKVFSLLPFINKHCGEKFLCHIDAVPDNFLFVRKDDGSEEIRLIDWEYAGMNDPHLDVAMFCIYAMYDKEQCDNLIDIYFQGNCTPQNRAKIYCYIAASGLLWSNWCEYKRIFAVEFGDYALAQYNYAKEFFVVATEAIAECGKDNA